MSRTTLAVLVILTVALAAWAGDTGLGTSPFTSGDQLTATAVNAMNDAINDNAADILVLEGYFSSGVGDLFPTIASSDTQADARTAIGAQADLAVPEDSELATGTATTERVLTAAKIKYAIEQHSTQIRTLTQEEEDEYVGELVYFDTGNYDPNSVGTDHYAIVTAAGTPGTYVPFLQNDGTWLSDSLATKAVIESHATSTDLDDSDCGKVILMTAAGEVGLPDCDADLVGCPITVWVQDASEQVTVDVNADATNEIILKAGTAIGAGDEADLTTTGNELFTFMCRDSGGKWVIIAEDDTVTDGGGS
jgi:hypothetical protein